jgi:hypothetical protein
MPNLGTHNVIDTDRIAIVLICGLSSQNNMLARIGIPSIVADSHDLPLNFSYHSVSVTIVDNKQLR